MPSEITGEDPGSIRESLWSSGGIGLVPVIKREPTPVRFLSWRGMWHRGSGTEPSRGQMVASLKAVSVV